MISSTRLLASIAGIVWLTEIVSETVAQTLPDARSEILPIPGALCNDMKSHNVLHRGAPVGCDRLRLVRFEHVGFDGRLHRGEIAVMDAVAEHVRRIFRSLAEMNFPIEKARL